MQVIVPTVQRNPYYFHQTLASMYMGGLPIATQLSVIMNDSSDILPNYQYPQLHKYCSDRSKYSHLNNSQKAGLNYTRCLQLITEDALIVEDDVVFAANWYAQLVQAINQLKEQTPYVLSLAIPWLNNNVLPEQVVSLTPFTNEVSKVESMPIENKRLRLLTATWARYFSDTLPGLKSHILSHMFQSPDVLHDLALDQFLYVHNISLFVMNAPLVKHIGVVSAIQAK